MLTIEDGTVVAGANSFVTVAECRTYCSERGLELPVNDLQVEKLLILSVDYITSLETDFQGFRAYLEQELPFPRLGVTVHGNDLSGLIPKTLKNAQSRLAFDFSQDDLFATGSGREVLQEGVGPLKVVYAQTGNTAPQVEPVAAIALLKPLFSFAAGSAFIPNVR